MKKFAVSIFIILLIAGFSISAVSSIESNQIVDGLNYTSDMTQALNNSEIENKTVLLLFDQENCYYCDLLKSDVLSDSNVQKELNENFIIVSVDINQEPQLAGEYQVLGTPTVIFLDSSNNELGRIDGYVPADEFLDDLKEI